MDKHFIYCEIMLKKLEDALHTSSSDKSTFEQSDILVIGHLCGVYGYKNCLQKVDHIHVKEMFGTIRVYY